MNTIYAVLACLLLAGCVTSRPVSLPNGVQGFAISCPGADRDIADCMNRAGKECNGPYSVVTQDGGTFTAGAIPVGQNVFFVAGVQRTLIVQCGVSASHEAEVRAFAADPSHPHFFAVREHMAVLIESGQAKNLEDAYWIAVSRAGLK